MWLLLRRGRDRMEVDLSANNGERERIYDNFGAKTKVVTIMKSNNLSVQTISALVMLACGTIMAFVSLLLPPKGEISSGALWYTGQCFLYSGGIFGIGAWAKKNVEEMQDKIDKKMKENEKGKQ